MHDRSFEISYLEIFTIRYPPPNEESPYFAFGYSHRWVRWWDLGNEHGTMNRTSAGCAHWLGLHILERILALKHG